MQEQFGKLDRGGGGGGDGDGGKGDGGGGEGGGGEGSGGEGGGGAKGLAVALAKGGKGGGESGTGPTRFTGQHLELIVPSSRSRLKIAYLQMPLPAAQKEARDEHVELF
ncbi:hypothetical protein Vafri_19066 [Volvox africanus]|uniref:Uncharacterized protein n=1 Tax=Volvox africanus TaxID=51714 RepID=A0A8J4FBQ5_9CHLO|nr:hypothetical protein Vafri_19066 [Volvox africanus]